MDENQLISLASLVSNKKYQTRVMMSEDAIADYVDAIRNAGRWPFPPIKVVRQVLVDGFHRIEATRRVIAAPETPAELRKLLQSIPCERVEVDPANHDISDLALQQALAANQTHGLMRSNADKRRAVELALDAWPDKSDREIAKLTGTSHPFVGRVRGDEEVETLPPQPTVSSCDSTEKVETLPLEPAPVFVPIHSLEVETLPPERKPVFIPENPVAEVETLPLASKPSSAKANLNGEVETLPTKKQRASCTVDEPSTVPEDAAKKLKSLAHQHRDKLVHCIDDYGRLKQNRSEQTRLVKLVQSVQLW